MVETKGKSSAFGSKRWIEGLCLGCLVVLPLFWAIRGIDPTDSGFVLTNQRYIFSHPHWVGYWFHLWLTSVVGGVWDSIFGRFGLLPHKIASAVIFWGMAALILAMYKGITKRKIVLPAIVLSLTYAFVYRINVIHYDNLSALVLVAGAVPLVRAVFGGREALYALSGFLLGLSVFVRVPNAVGLGLILVPPILKLVFKKTSEELKFRGRDFFIFGLGVLGAVAACFAAMCALGHLNLYLCSLLELSKHGINKGAYNLSRLIKRPLFDTLYALLYGFPAVIAILGFSWTMTKAPRPWMRLGIGAVLGAGILGLLLVNAYDTDLYFVFRLTAGVCYWATIALLVDQKADPRLRLLSVVASCLTLVLNVGSDTRIMVASYGFPVMMPALFATFAYARGRLSGLSGEALFKNAIPVVSALLVGFSAGATFTLVFRDSSLPNYCVKGYQLDGVLTSKERAHVLCRDLPIISELIPPGSTLLAYGNIPIVHFIAHTRPYLGNSWADQYSYEYLDLLLRKAEMDKEPLPLVLVAKRDVFRPTWPSAETPLREMPEVLTDFLKRNSYRVRWSSDAFTLYSPQSY